MDEVQRVQKHERTQHLWCRNVRKAIALSAKLLDAKEIGIFESLWESGKKYVSGRRVMGGHLDFHTVMSGI